MLLTVAACKKQDTIYYQGAEAISFYLNQYEVDSLDYTFAYDAVPKDKDTILLKMRIQGATKDFDRVIQLKVGEGSTAVANQDYILPSVVVPAKAVVVDYPVILLNSSKLLTSRVHLVLEVGESEDFKPGVLGREVGGTTAINKYKISFNNIPEEPGYWASIAYYFGSHSIVKHRFMIKTLGISDFSYESIGAYGLYNYPVALRNALSKYEDENGGPLIDEKGFPVTF